MTDPSVSNVNRQARRHQVSWPLTYVPFSSAPVPPVDATAFNTSDYGMCFLSPFPLEVNQYIYVRSRPIHPAPLSGDHQCIPMKTHSLAQVRWCLNEPSAGTPAYLIGIRYL